MTLQEFLNRLNGVKPNGKGYMARCPAHDDRQQSLSVSQGDDGRILLKCFAGCEAQDIVAAMGLDMRDLFPNNANRAPRRNSNGPVITTAQLAADKGLPADFLAFYTEDIPSLGVKIIYKTLNGKLATRQRLRVALSAKEGSRWMRGPGHPVPYGLWRIPRMSQESDTLLLVEGESDAWTAWYHKIAALGIPGADMTGKLDLRHVEPFRKVLIWKEPDQGGETFVRGLTQRLAALGYNGEVFVVQGPPDEQGRPVKDLNQLHKNTLRSPSPAALFKELWEAIVAAAVRVDLSTVNLNRASEKTDQDVTHVYKDFTDEGNADRFVELHGQDIRYCGDWKKWMIWNGKYWEKDRTGEIYRRAATVAHHVLQEAAAETDRDRQDALIEHAKKLRNRAKIKTMVETAESRVPAVPEQFDQDVWLLNVQNGTLDLRTGDLRPHRREDYITKITPVAYVPYAKAPLWEKFLRRVTGDNEELMAFLQRAAGYALTGDTSEHCLFFLHGEGRNGKSVFLNALEYIMGDYGTTARPEVLMVKKYDNGIPNEIAALAGVRFVSTTETESGKRFAESMLKQYTGGDLISARFLHAEFFTFRPQFKIFLASNHKPVIRGQDTAIWERIYLIPFTVYIPPEERDKHLSEKLRAEAEGILRWAVEGCLAWQKEGLKPPDVVRAATEEYKNEMDALGDFLADCCVLLENATVSNSALWDAYMNWCKENGEKYPLSRREFKANLERRGLVQLRKGSRYWSGIGLRADMEAPAQTAQPEKEIYPGHYSEDDDEPY